MEIIVGKFREFIFLRGPLKIRTLASVFIGVVLRISVFVRRKTVMCFYGYKKLFPMFLEHMGRKI